MFAIPPFLPSLLVDPVVAGVFYVAACAGHTFFMVVSLNVFYAWRLPRAVLRFSRKLDMFAIFLGPVLFWYAMGFHDGGGVSWEAGGRGHFLVPYLLFCWVLGLVVAPAAMILYHLRRTPPAARVGYQVHAVDVARALGYPPAGHNKQAFLTRIPGNQAFKVDFAQITLQMPQLPSEWDGLTILHLSDLHFCGSPGRDFYRYVMDHCLQLGTPDLLAITGDIVDGPKHHRWVVPLLGRLKWRQGAFAILGNHDYWHDPQLTRRRLRKVGIRVLGNSWEQMEVRGQPLVVIGNEYPWSTPQANLSACPPPLIASGDKSRSEGGAFRLCLSHTPDRLAWCRRQRVDLMLAGHVHGGQIRLPLIGSVFVPSRFSRRYDCGTFFEKPTLMHVSRGLAGQHPLRFNCPPEVTWIVLQKGSTPA